MRRRTRVRAGLVLAIGGALALAGSALAAEHTVTIANFDFSPGSTTIAAGDTVIWSNDDTTGHTATAGDGTFDTGTIAPGDTASVTFAKAGTYAYTCTIHPAMTGTIVVEAASSGGGSGGGEASAPSTDAASPTDMRPADDDTIWTAAMLLAAVGVVMLVGSLWYDRRTAKETIDRR
jgi:plastocyanin